MNILLFVIQDTFIGGAESVLHQVSEFYVKRGHQVYVLFFLPRKYGHWEKDKSDNLHLLYGGGFVRLIKNFHSLKRITFDYSYSSLVDLTGILGIVRRLKIIRIKAMIGRESTSIFDRYKGLGLWRKKLMYRLGYPAVDVLVCQTHYMKERLLQTLPWIENRRKVVVIPNPIDLEQIPNHEEIDSYPLDTPFIVTAGRFIPEKGYDILINSFLPVKQKHPELKLVILGDGALRSTLESQIESLGLTGDVLLPGYTKNVYPWFRMAKTCVISSRVEGFPNVLLQMMSQNERVVSTLCAGDIDKINGLITCPSNNTEALSKAIIDSLESEFFEKNRLLFDEELHRRSIECFINKVETTYINKYYNGL